MPTPFGPWKAALGSPHMRGGAEVAGVSSPGHAYQGTSREPRRAPCLCAQLGQVTPIPKAPGPRGVRAPPKEANKPSSAVTCCQGKPEAQARAGEQSYESIVPRKVEKRRALARGGHDIHWREGTNRSTHRYSATGTRL